MVSPALLIKSIKTARAGGDLMVLYDSWFDPAIADHCQRVARSPTGWIMVDCDWKGHSAPLGLTVISEAPDVLARSHPASRRAKSAPAISATANPGTSIGRMPEKVFVSERAIATGGVGERGGRREPIGGRDSNTQRNQEQAINTTYCYHGSLLVHVFHLVRQSRLSPWRAR